MLAVPPALLDLLHLKAGASVGLSVEGNQLIVKPQKAYTLTQLLAECEATNMAEDDATWVSEAPVGDELI